MAHPSIAEPFRPDTSTYFTVTHPEHQTRDWKAFYDTVDARSAKTRARVRTELDIEYGEHPKQFLDVYLPPPAETLSPVLVFVHGGGFREGDRAHYGYLAEPFAASGITTVVPSYRLLPESTFFDAVDDVRATVAWVVSEIATRGGDSARIVIAGHSAGGVLAAHVAADTTWHVSHSIPPGTIRAVAAISAAYDFTTGELPSYARSRLEDDTARREASPLHRIRAPVPRATVAVGARESLYLPPSRAFATALREAGVATELLILSALDHAGTVLALGGASSELHRAVLELLRD